MKKPNSIPLPDEETRPVSWEMEGNIYSIKVKNKHEVYTRSAIDLIKDKFAEVKQRTTTRLNDSNFTDMMLVAIEAEIDALQMKAEYERLLLFTQEKLANIQSQLDDNT